MVIASNRASNQGSNISSLYYHSGTPPSADYIVEADVYINSTDFITSRGQGSGVCARVSTSANTFYTARYGVTATGTVVLNLYKFVAGTPTQLGSNVSTGYSAGQTKHVKLKVTGTTIEAFMDGSATADISVTDSAISDAGRVGIRIYTDSAARRLDLDNFDANDGGDSGGALIGGSALVGASNLIGASPLVN